MKHACIAVGISSAVAMTACGDHEVGGLPDRGARPDSGAGDGYPAGPYGNNPDDILINMVFDGYVNDRPDEGLVQQGPFVQNFELQDIRALGTARFLLLNVAAEWCVGCRIEAEQLPGRYPNWSERGGYVLSVLIEDTSGNPATRRNLDRWVANFSLNYATVHDPQMFVTRELGPDTLPLNVLVDLNDMRIVASVIGEDFAVFDTFSNLLQP